MYSLPILSPMYLLEFAFRVLICLLSLTVSSEKLLKPLLIKPCLLR